MKFIKNMSKKKRIIFIVCLSLLLVGLIVLLVFAFKPKNTEISNNNQERQENNNEENEEVIGDIDVFEYDPTLPKPEITTGQRGELGIDKNINESTIDNYLGRADSVYRDMRMLEDPAEYSKIGGNSKLDGFINGFEVVPLPYIIPVNNLPKEVGNTYSQDTLFHLENGVYVPNYEESMSIIEKLFPKNKYIFLMCGGGGYAGMMKEFLVSMGWKEDRIYNVGGYWYYEGNNSVITLNGIGPKGEDYDFSKVNYHNIEFDKLTKSTNYVIPDYKVESLSVNTDYVKLNPGMSFQLKVIVLPNGAKNKKLKWKSLSPETVSVDQNGLARGIKPGIASIIVTSEENPINKYLLVF